jgi:hypothetical protein
LPFKVEDFKKIPIIDCHMHLTDIRDIHLLLNVVSHADFHRAAVVCTISKHRINFNPEGLVLKVLHPEMFFIFGALDYFSLLKGKTSCPSLPEQVDNIIKIGFDGVKMVEGRSGYRKLLNTRFDSDYYDGFFKRLEETGFPLLLHAEKQQYEEIVNVLDQHKDLRVVLAHFFFLSKNIDAASQFLKEYKTVHLDLCVGLRQYYDFSANREAWRDFFIKYQDRILFGTDTASTRSVKEAVDVVWRTRMFLETCTEFHVPKEIDKSLDGHVIRVRGLDLPTGSLEKIYSGNFRKLAGYRPRKINLESAFEECGRLAKEEAALRGKPIRKTAANTTAAYLKNILPSIV